MQCLVMWRREWRECYRLLRDVRNQVGCWCVRDQVRVLRCSAEDNPDFGLGGHASKEDVRRMETEVKLNVPICRLLRCAVADPVFKPCVPRPVSPLTSPVPPSIGTRWGRPERGWVAPEPDESRVAPLARDWKDMVLPPIAPRTCAWRSHGMGVCESWFGLQG